MENLNGSLLNESLIGNALSYSSYRKMLDGLIAEGKTTGPNQDEWLVDYTRLNVQRMNRWDKTWLIPEQLEQSMLEIERPMVWLTIAEGWCGDAAQVLPIVEKLAASNPMIRHRVILRDEHPAIMDQFLTNGSRSIPKVIFLDGDELSVLGSWGPRPAEASELLNRLKQNGELPREELYNQLHAWYAKDKGQKIANELIGIMKQVGTQSSL